MGKPKVDYQLYLNKGGVGIYWPARGVLPQLGKSALKEHFARYFMKLPG